MKWIVWALACLLLCGAAFYAGTFYPHHVTQATPTVSKPATVVVADDPVERLQLDNLCGQSATTFNGEHETKGLDSQNDFQHGYNQHLGKCFVLLRSFFSGSSMGTNYSMEEDFLYDAVTGTNYGNYRVKMGPGASGPVHREVNLCSTFPDGVTLHQCTSEDDWKSYTESLMHG